jgi:hypothetical protein
MSDKHEKYLAEEIFGPNSVVMPNSGATWAKQMDVRGKHREETFAFAVDGKSTFSASVGVTIPMWQKAVEQAHNELPALALRWYNTWQLDSKLDLIVIDANTFKSMTEHIRELEDKLERLNGNA